MTILCVKYRQKLFFTSKIVKNMRFSWDFFCKICYKNAHSNLQTKFRVHITSNIFKKIQFKNHGIAPTPPDLPTLKAYPTPGVCGRFKIWQIIKMKGKDELKGIRSKLTLSLRDFEYQGENCLGVVAAPLRRTRVKCCVFSFLWIFADFSNYMPNKVKDLKIW